MSLALAILGAIPTLLKLIMMIVEGLRKTPGEKRRESLAELDKALKLAKDKNNLKELSTWFGKRL